MRTLIILVLGYIGTFVFALSGTRLFDWDNPKTRWKAPITAFLSSFGGGLTRDLLVLHCTPAILNAQIDLCILALSVLCYVVLYFTHRTSIFNRTFVKKALTLLDGAGTAVFICMGGDAAARCGAPWMIVLFCGTITAIGGGIWAAIVSGRHLQVILHSATTYRTIVVVHATIYSVWKCSIPQVETSMIMAFIISCTACCYIQEYLIAAENIDSHSTKACRIGRKRVYLLPTRAQLFWSVLNPIRGRKISRIVLVNGGKQYLLLSIAI